MLLFSLIREYLILSEVSKAIVPDGNILSPKSFIYVLQ